MKSRPKLYIKQEALGAWVAETFGPETGAMTRAVKAFEALGIDRNSFFKYKNASNEPPVMFFYAVMTIAPATNMWTLLEKVA
jgi:hypothetical protein